MNPKQLKAYENKKKCERDMFCVKCNKIYKNTTMTTCGLCGTILALYSDNIPKCPTCQSPNIKRISGIKKAVHGCAFGVLSKTARSQFECNNCGYKW